LRDSTVNVPSSDNHFCLSFPIANKPEDEVKDKIYTKGCFAAFEDEILGNVAVAAGVGVGVAVLLLLGVIISCCVARNMKERNNYV
jgi:hypothetical protein